MTKVVHFSEAEVAESSDWENASLYAREGDEAIVGGAIGYPHHWAGHSISQTSAIEIAINPGALFTGGIVYRNEEPISVNLQLYLPLVTGDRRYVALLLRGEEKTEQESRLFEVDADTEETVERMTPKTGLRQIVCVVQQGLTSPTPVKPVVAADQCCLGFVELSTTGIVAIEMDNARRVKTLYELVIANTTIAAALLTTGWNKFSIRPSPLESGKRYAWFTVTTGNHALETVSGNKFAQGSQFHVTDGAWAQGSTTVDFAMRLNAASFASTRTVVEFQPLILENGMTDIRLLHAGWTLGGTAMTWEIRPSDADEWRPLNDTIGERTPLAGLPPLVRLRAVFTGTTDLQPAIILDAYARGMTFRPRGDMQAVSIEHQFGLSSQTIQVEAVIDQYDPQKHTVSPKLIVGGTVLTPTTCVITPDLVSDKKKTWLATYLLGAPATSARVRLDMTTTEVTDIPFIQNIAYYAL
ncbi:hypothetical protein [Rhodomicrobium lacus]|uniref:hypothetical protein n=1 Tax=Rhodomicrobium lacus TaxID=2498452 RepID=UPI000F8E08E3|nr:hypothetical protein [Rhodomicrobium lacus]